MSDCFDGGLPCQLEILGWLKGAVVEGEVHAIEDGSWMWSVMQDVIALSKVRIYSSRDRPEFRAYVTLAVVKRCWKIDLEIVKG